MATSLTNPNYQPTDDRYVPPTQFKELQKQVDDVTRIMKDNIELELKRGQKLDDLECKAEDLSRSAEKFSVTTKKVKRTYQMKNIKMRIILGILITLILAGIIVGIVFGVKNKQ